MRKLTSVVFLVGLLAWLVGCTSHQLYREAQLAEQQEDWDRVVVLYLELLDKQATNIHYRTGLLRAKIRASQEHFERAKKLHEAGARERAMLEYQQAVQLDPTNQYAQVQLDKVRSELAQRRDDGTSDLSLQEIKDRTTGTRPQPPTLNPRSMEPIDLSFPNPVSIFEIYQSLGKAFGINILFDPKLRPQQVSIELVEVTAQSALEILMRTANHFYKVLDEQTLIIAEDTPQNRRAYEDLVIQTFFLSNAETKDVMTMLRSLVGAKNVASNDQLNAIVLRDTADKVKVAEKIIATNDKSRGEVVVNVELLQIGTSKLQELGISLSDYRVTQSVDPNPIRVSELEFLNQANWMLTLPAIIYDFVRNHSEAQLLANPQLRISDGEQATLHIGDRVPIPVTTFNTAQTVGGNIVPITSFQYQDIGIRLDLTPRIHHNRQVSLELSVEVSQLSGFVPGSGGQQQPIIGTRTIESTIRLANGETNFLAGLIREDETNTKIGVPGLMEIPVIGRLFSKTSIDRDRTDLVLTLTPHIVRTPDITEEDLLPIWVGTEQNITFRGGSPRVESEVDGPFDEDEEGGAERIREMIRRRIQNLPRGLREGQEEEAEDPTGVDLAPTAAPTDVFAPTESDDDDQGEPLASAMELLPSDVQRSIVSSAELESSLGRLSSLTVEGSAESGDESELTVADWLPQPVLVVAAADPAASAVQAETPAATGAAAKATAVSLSLAPSPLNVQVGQEFELQVMVDATKNIHHLPMTITYEAEYLEVLAVEKGIFMGGEEECEVLADFSTPGEIILGASRLGDVDGVKGQGTVARIRFKALAIGSPRVRFDDRNALNKNLKFVKPVKSRPGVVEVVPGGSFSSQGATD
jgi:general secretion pathway protein D